MTYINFKRLKFMKHFIGGKEVTDEDIGSPVTYIPRHAKGDVNHPDCERGHISSITEDHVLVRYKAACGAATPTDLLVWEIT